jgi:hypothetical protein
MFSFDYQMHYIQYIYQLHELLLIGSPVGLPNTMIYLTCSMIDYL